MKTLNRGLFISCLIFANYRCIDAAGNLFNAFGTMIGNRIPNEPSSPPILSLNPINNGNNNFRPNTGFNNNFGTTNNNNNSPFKFKDPYKDPEIETNIESKLKLGLELSEDEKLAAQKFPGIKDLLDKLKELNRQKELQKQKENEKNGFNNGGLPNNNHNIGFPNSNGGSTNNNINGGLPNFNNNGGVNNGNGNAGNDIDGDEEEVPGKGVNRWLKLKKRKFYFQAQPVRPENEIVVEPEVVYYLN